MKIGSRALYLVPDDRSAEKVRTAISSALGYTVFDASQIEESKTPFVQSNRAVAVVANRYDGIDLINNECRLLLADGLPGGANLQERFFVLRVTAQLLLDDRILTRLVQGFGRCTRSPNDYAAVIVLGENLNNYLFKKERREFFHPEIQAELDFGLEQSKAATSAGMLDNLRHFMAQDAEWDEAEKAIIALRGSLTQRTLAAAPELAAAVAGELAYQYALWNADYLAAVEQCRGVIGKLTHSDLREYRALWLYLAGSAAWLAHQAGQLSDDGTAKDYFRQAQAAAPVLRWHVRGRVIALWIDGTIRKESDSRRSLDDVMFDLVRQKDQPYTLERILAFINRFLSLTSQGELMAAVSRHGALTMPAQIPILGSCAKATFGDYPMFDLGFDIDRSQMTKVVSGVADGGPAFRAGLRDGDKLLGVSYYKHDPDRQARFTIASQDGPKRITYLPQGSPARAWQYLLDPTLSCDGVATSAH